MKLDPQKSDSEPRTRSETRTTQSKKKQPIIGCSSFRTAMAVGTFQHGQSDPTRFKAAFRPEDKKSLFTELEYTIPELVRPGYSV